jgi:hypothetical protein
MTTQSIDFAARTNRPLLTRLAPVLSRIVMIPPMVIMILVATRYIFNPTHAASPTGVALTTPEAITDTRVVGGLTLTIAFVIGSAILTRGHLRTGHLTVIALMAFVLAVRLFGFAQDGTTLAMGDQKVKTIGECLFLTLNTAGLALQSYQTKQSNRRA